MERFALEELKKWKENPDRKPLVLMGARQVPFWESPFIREFHIR